MLTSTLYKITYYNTKVFSEIITWPKQLVGKYMALTEAMILRGPNLGMPYTRSMGQGLFKIRVSSQDNIGRVFFCTKEKMEIVILHSFIKKTQETPYRELEIARRRLKEVKNIHERAIH